MGAVAAILGAALLFVGTSLHPMETDPSVPLVVFREYAANRLWVASHLVQLSGIVFIVAALVLLARKLAGGPAADWATLGMAGAIAGLGVASALQAVDGVALKVMVDTWAATPQAGKVAVFRAAVAVREIEIGLASMTSLLFGLTASIYGIALFIDGRFPKWLAASAVAGGVPTAVAGVVIAYAGFSPLSMAINLSAGSVLILWMIVLGGYAFRRAMF